MTKQTEDTLFEINTSVDNLGIRKQFKAQLKKMASQEKHKWKSAVECWEYAYGRVSPNKGVKPT